MVWFQVGAGVNMLYYVEQTAIKTETGDILEFGTRTNIETGTKEKFVIDQKIEGDGSQKVKVTEN